MIGTVITQNWLIGMILALTLPIIATFYFVGRQFGQIVSKTTSLESQTVNHIAHVESQLKKLEEDVINLNKTIYSIGNQILSLRSDMAALATRE